jgi:mRNA interferase MazF
VAYAGRVRQWALFEADLNFPVGSEQGGDKRPVLVVSNDGFNAQFSVVTVLPLTKREGKQRQVYPFEVELPAGTAGNPLDSIIMPQQIRTIAKQRLLGPPLGTLADPALRRAVEDRVLQHLGIALDEHDDAADDTSDAL